MVLEPPAIGRRAHMETVLQDLKQAVRGLGKNSGALITAVLTLAVGIGFSTATFSVTNAVLLRPLLYDEPSRLVNLSEQVPPRTIQFAVSPAHYLFWRDHATAFEGIGAWQRVQVSFQSGGEDPQRVHADRVTANLFAILRVTPALGRAFLPSDDESGAHRVALLSRDVAASASAAPATSSARQFASINSPRRFVTSLSLPVDAYPPGDPRERFLHEFLVRARALPDVAAIGLAMPMPMVDVFSNGLEIEGQPLPRDRRPSSTSLPSAPATSPLRARRS